MIREYQENDHHAIAQIFVRAIHEIASEVYTPEQCHAWSDKNPNPEHWKKRRARKKPFVAQIKSQIAGFLELDPDGHIDCAYVNPDFQRLGVMTRLVRHAIKKARAENVPKVYVEASICAKPLFEKEGFHLLSENLVIINGISLKNYLMELPLSPPSYTLRS